MRTKGIAIVVGVAAWLAAGRAAAQAPEIDMHADRETVALGEVFQLQIRVTIEGQSPTEHIEVPSLDAFAVEGRSISRPMQFSFGFGQGPVVRQTTAYTFDLRAVRVGQFTIAPVEATAGGRRYRGQPVTIRVLPAGSAAPPPTALRPSPFDPWAGSPLSPGLTPLVPLPSAPDVAPSAPPPGAIPLEELTGAQVDDQMFIRTVLDKPTAFVGEQVTLTIYLYARVGIRDLDVPQEPGTDGFWVEDLIGPIRRLDFQDQYVGATRYEAAVIRKMAIFPIRAGTIPIEPMEVLASVSTGGFFGSAQLRRRGVPVELRVQPLPAEGQPRGFEASNVGLYEMTARLDRSQVQAGEPATMTVTVEGEGNFRNVRLSMPASSPGLRLYDPQVRDTPAVHGDVIAGRREWEILVIPQQAGRFEVPVPVLSFFDPHARRYGTVAPRPLVLVATGTAGSTADGVTGREPRAERSIRLASDLRRRGPRLYQTLWFGLAVAVPPLAYLGLLLGSSLRRRRDAQRVRSRPRRALSTARRILDEARRAAAAGDATRCFAGVARALQTFLEERTQRPIGGMTLEELRRYFDRRGVPDELIERLVRELENCDFARFTPEGGRAKEMSDSLERADALLSELDRVALRPEVSS